MKHERHKLMTKVNFRFVCPEESIFGDWTNLRSFLVAWQKLRFAKKGEVLESLPPLGFAFNLDQVKQRSNLFSHPQQNL